MHTTMKLLVAALSLAAGLAVAHEPPPVPADYPSHRQVGGCTSQAALREGLQAYNVARLEVADVLRNLAKEDGIAQDSRTQLLGYAEQFEEMRRRMPEPDPDSNEFRNFDFQIGLAFASMAVFLNTKDEALADRFFKDRDQPASDLGRYLAHLERSRVHYTSQLDRARSVGCAS
ncbi:MAG: hypothetical protein KDI82_01975 [Gammaproteobacteria bacterium]|nr:hypothetical protein [Gammaproteobacteria bacterium]